MLRILLIGLIFVLPMRDISIISSITVRPFDILASTFIFVFLLNICVGKLRIMCFFKNKLVSFCASLFLLSQIIYSGYGLVNGGDTFLILRELVWSFFYLTFFICLYSYLVSMYSKQMLSGLIKIMVNIWYFYLLILLPCYYMQLLKLELWNNNNTLIWKIKGIELLRFSGLASEPGYLISCMLFPFILSVFACFNKELRNLLNLNHFKIIIIIASFLLSFSSFGWLVMVITLVVYFMILEKNIVKKFTYITLFVLSFSVALATVPVVKEFSIATFDKIVNGKGYSASERDNWRTIATDMFTEKPLIGWGVGTYSTNMKSYADELNIKVRHAEDANSVFYLYLAERGVIGETILCVLLVSVILPFLLIYYQGTISVANKYILISFIMSICIQYLHWMITGVMWLYYFWFHLAIGFAVCFLLKSRVTVYSQNYLEMGGQR